jgi:hypothetical protein
MTTMISIPLPALHTLPHPHNSQPATRVVNIIKFRASRSVQVFYYIAQLIGVASGNCIATSVSRGYFILVREILFADSPTLKLVVGFFRLGKHAIVEKFHLSYFFVENQSFIIPKIKLGRTPW